MHNEKFTLRGAEEELQAYYLAETAMEKVFAIVKDNANVIERFTPNKTYGRYELESLQKTLSGKDAASIQSLRAIPNISITKTSTSSNACQLRVEVSAKYYSAKKSLVANIRVGLPLNGFQGIYIQALPDIQNNSSLETPLYILNENPHIDLNWYARNCDYYYGGDQVLRAEDLTEGIHYIEGNVTLTGIYQGKITLISSGMVTIAAGASLRAANAAKDSLFILAQDKVLVASEAQVDALVYTTGTMQLANQAQLAGTIICNEFICHGAAVFSQPLLNSIHPTWTTTEIEILTWQEKYPVFPMN